MIVKRGYAPGWVARCPVCPYEIDLESLGWTRIGAYSWGKRHSVYCPDCKQKRSMRILHVDELGNPDQSFAKVLSMVLLMQAAIWSLLIGILLLMVTLFSLMAS